MWEDVLIVKLSEKDIEVKVPESNFACGIPIDLTGNFLWKPKGNYVSGELICSLTWAQKKKRGLSMSILQICSHERLNVSGKQKGDTEPFTSRSLA